ncbi:Major facilitator superfamily domain general substrate transporter [Penicillium cataractarum]|uniref:Major facilitator superfamily domain general substrate transporter n=1 Tax=Penicillium cataractarum TaxID=2100454 RepID=A0A9W9V995_9EURO|nr:Major facilitator superfamily domain general substrate transporter [Penicillium cataractarum]KAJ5371006.1 Major facilitator superfamily domain general substrate transporter [Penicillium cataractarum]
MPTTIISVAVAAVSMMMVPLFRGYVWLLRLSWVILTLVCGLLALFNVGTSTSMRYGLPILWGQVVALLCLNILPMQAGVKNVDDTGLAIGLFLTIRMFGGLVGLAISSSVFNNFFSKAIADITVQLSGALASLKDGSNAVSFIDSLRSIQVSILTLDQALGVYPKCFRTIFYVMTRLSALDLVTSISRELGSQRFED